MTEPILLIDGDILVYKTIHACVDDNEWWKVQWTADKLLQRLCQLAGCTKYLSFLTDSSTNFRLDRATTWVYKGNRPPLEEQPRWKKEVQAHYMSLGWQMMRGVEADDALTISAEVLLPNTEVACATIDKDLKQYPWDSFVDMNKDTVYNISPETAHRNLWKQVLIGDKPTDNIPGISHAAKYEDVGERDPKVQGLRDLLVGNAGAEKLLDSWEPDDYPSRILTAYVDAYEGMEGQTQEVRDECAKKGICFGEYRFYETFDLVWLLRKAPEDLVINYDFLTAPKFEKRTTIVFEDLSDEEF